MRYLWESRRDFQGGGGGAGGQIPRLPQPSRALAPATRSGWSAAHTFQADVETVHRLIEDEFYEVEAFCGLEDFFHKAYTYNLWFNFARTNSYKESQTPWQIIHTRQPDLPKSLLAFPVILLDHAWAQQQQAAQGGYDVIQYPSPLHHLRSGRIFSLDVLAGSSR